MSNLSHKNRNIGIAIKILFVVCCVGLLFVYSKDIYELFTNTSLLKEILVKLGPIAWIGFLVINIVQVIVAPVPGPAISVLGGFLFGFWKGLLLNLIGTVIGSIIAFLLARWLGKPLVDKFVSGRTKEFLEKATTRRGVKSLVLIFLLPFLPSDALCFFAGLSPIKFKTFLTIVSFCRVPGLAVASMTGSGLIDLPIIAWVAIGAIASLLLVFYWYRGTEIESWIKKLVTSLD